MGGAGSLTYQVQEAFKAILRLGESKRMARLEHQARIQKETGKKVPINQVQVDWLYSIKSMKVYSNLCVTFVQWAKRKYGIRYLTQLDMAMMGTRYLREEFIDKKRSAYTIKTVYAALRKLPVALRHRWNADIGDFDHEALGKMPARSLDDRIWAGEYEESEFEAIVRWLRAKKSPKAHLAAVVIEIQRHTGLRISEAVGLRARMVSETQCALIITETNITKGGRDRKEALPVPHDLLDRLLPLVQTALAERGPEARILLLRTDYVRRCVRTACGKLQIERHGTHGFRHSYANDRYDELIAAGVIHEDAMKQVAEDLGHSRPGITKTYVRY